VQGVELQDFNEEKNFPFKILKAFSNILQIFKDFLMPLKAILMYSGLSPQTLRSSGSAANFLAKKLAF